MRDCERLDGQRQQQIGAVDWTGQRVTPNTVATTSSEEDVAAILSIVTDWDDWVIKCRSRVGPAMGGYLCMDCQMVAIRNITRGRGGR